MAPIVVGGAVEVLGVPFRAGGAWWGGARMMLKEVSERRQGVVRKVSGRCQRGVREVSGRCSESTVIKAVATIQFVQAEVLIVVFG